MTKFTKEQLQRIADTDHVQCGDAAEMARQLLAGLEQEPVAWIVHTHGGNQLSSDASYVANAERFASIRSTSLYAAPQLPQPAVVVPSIKPDWMNNEFNAGWNACRAAMLQGAEPVLKEKLSGQD